MMMCIRCGGRLYKDRDGDTSCFMCGYYHYTEEELREAHEHAQRDLHSGARQPTYRGINL